MAKEKHACNLKTHQVKVTHLNHSPEKAGQGGLVPRVDLSFELEMSDVDTAELVRGRTGSNVIKSLWDKAGAPILLDAKPLHFDIEFTGKAELRFVNAADEHQRFAFDSSRLRKPVIEPMSGHKALVKLQLRVDPGEHLNVLSDMRIAERCLFMFTGRGADGEDGDGGKQRQLGEDPEE